MLAINNFKKCTKTCSGESSVSALNGYTVATFLLYKKEIISSLGATLKKGGKDEKF